MTLGFRDERRHRQQRRRWLLVKWAVGLGAVALAGLFAYDTGLRLAEARVEDLNAEIAALTSRVADLDQELAAQRAAVEAAKTEASTWRDRYARDIPAGELKRVVDTLRGRLAEGVPADRLRFVIDAVSRTRDCPGRALTKRLSLRTPLSRRDDDTVSFGGGSVVVSGSGMSAQNAAGNPEAWFDPAREITLHLVHVSGKKETVSGILPLQQSLIAGENEYRFSVVGGSRGFVEVTGETCRFP